MFVGNFPGIDQQLSIKLADKKCTVSETFKLRFFSFWKSICLEDEVFGDASFILAGGPLAVSFRADAFAMTGLKLMDSLGWLLSLVGTGTFYRCSTRVQDSCILCWSSSLSIYSYICYEKMKSVSWHPSFFITIFMPVYCVFRKYLGIPYKNQQEQKLPACVMARNLDKIKFEPF